MIVQAIQSVIESVRTKPVQQHQNLAVVPLVKENGHDLEFLVLEEALKAGGLIIKEAKSQSVPVLELENKTGKEVVLIAGEYLIGGGQNRTLAVSLYLAPEYTGEIPVHCVQHGRWQRTSEGFSYGGHVTSGIKSSKTQQAVWDSVTTTMNMTGSRSGSEDYDEIRSQKEAELESVTSRFKPVANQVGLMTIIGINGGKKFVVDLFDKPDTMQKHYDKIIEAHALEGLPHRNSKFEVSQDEIDNFWRGLRSAQASERSKVSMGTDYNVSTSHGEGSALVKDGKTVYLNLVSK